MILSDLDTLETYAELGEWVSEHFPGGSIHVKEEEIVIHTNLMWIMGGLLNPLGPGLDD